MAGFDPLAGMSAEAIEQLAGSSAAADPLGNVSQEEVDRLSGSAAGFDPLGGVSQQEINQIAGAEEGEDLLAEDPIADRPQGQEEGLPSFGSRVSWMMAASEDLNAERARKVRAIMRRFDNQISPQYVEDNFDMLRKEVVKRDFDADAFIRDSPSVAAYIARSPTDAVMLQAQADHMGAWEKAYRAVTESSDVGFAQYEMLQILKKEFGLGLLDKDASPEEKTRLEQLRAYVQSRPQYKVGLAADTLAKGASQLGLLRFTAEEASKYGLAMAAGGAAAGAIGGAAAGGVGAIPGAISGGGAGLLFGLAAGRYVGGGISEGLLAWDEYRRQPNADPETARNLAIVVMGINGALEGLGDVALLKGIPGAAKLAKGTLAKLMKDTRLLKLANQFGTEAGRVAARMQRDLAGRNLIGPHVASRVKGLVVTMQGEGLEEVAQEYNTELMGGINQLVGEGVLRRNDPVNWVNHLDKISARVHTPELSKKLWEAYKSGVQVGGLFGGLGGLPADIKLAAVRRAQRKASLNKSNNLARAQALQNDQIEPEAVEEMARDASSASFYVPVRSWDRAIRSIDPQADPREQAEVILGDVAIYDRAVAAGESAELAIPAARYEAYISKHRELSQRLAGEGRADPIDLTESDLIEMGVTRDEAPAALRDVGLQELEASLRQDVEQQQVKHFEDRVATHQASVDVQKRTQEISAEVTRELMKDPGQVAYHIMGFGKLPDGTEIGSFRINKQSAIDVLGHDAVASFPSRPRSVFAKSGGMHIDDAVDMLPGIVSAQDLHERLSTLRPLRTLAAEMTEERMATEMQVQLSETEAMEAMDHVQLEARPAHIDAEIDLIRQRLAAAASDVSVETLGRLKPTDAVLRQEAEEFVLGYTGRQAKPALFRAAMQRDNRHAHDSFGQERYLNALDEKLSERVNFERMRAAEQLQDKLQKGIDLFRRTRKPSVRRRMGKVRGLTELVDALVDRYDYRVASSGPAIIPGSVDPSLLLDVEQQTGVPISIDADLLTRSQAAHLLDVPIHEALSAIEAVTQLTHVAKVAEEGLRAAKKAKTDQVAAEILQELQGVEIRKTTADLMPAGFKELKKGIDSVAAAQRKVSFILKDLRPAGMETTALEREILGRTNQAQSVEFELNREAGALLQKAFDRYSRKERNAWYSDRQWIPELGQHMGKVNLLALALNASSNMRLLEVGWGFSRQKVQETLDRYLTAKDAAFVQDIYDAMSSKWQEAAELERRVTGRIPKRAAFEPVSIGGTTIRGGYYTIYAARDNSAATTQFGTIAGAGQEISNTIRYARDLYQQDPTATLGQSGEYGAFAMTRHGYLKSRAEQSQIRPELSFAAIRKHMSEVAHDLAFREAVIDIRNLVRRNDVSSAIIQRVGHAVFSEIPLWLRDVAGARPHDILTGWESILAGARTAMSAMKLGARVSVSLIQGTDLVRFKSILGRNGHRWMLHALRHLYANPLKIKAKWEQAFALSPRLRSRLGELSGHRDLSDFHKRLGLPGERFGTSGRLADIRDKLSAKMFLPIAFMDTATAMVGWHAAYLKAMNGDVRGLRPEDGHQAIVDYADQVVADTLGGGESIDLARIQRGPETFKMMTAFLTFGNVAYNQFHQLKQTVKRGDYGSFLNYLFFSGLIPLAIEETLRRNWPDTEGEDEQEAIKRHAMHFASKSFDAFIGTIPVLREVVSKKRYGSFGNPVLDVIGQAGQGASLAIDQALQLYGLKEDSDLTRTEARKIFSLVAFIARLPEAQMLKTWDGLRAWMEADKVPGNLVDAFYQVLITGPKHKGTFFPDVSGSPVAAPSATTTVPAVTAVP